MKHRQISAAKITKTACDKQQRDCIDDLFVVTYKHEIVLMTYAMLCFVLYKWHLPNDHVNYRYGAYQW